MKSLHDKVNIVPVIAKADTLTKREVKAMKERVWVLLTATSFSEFPLSFLSRIASK